MSAAIEQIKTAYEINGMSIDEIASEFPYDTAAIKAALVNSSKKYRKECGLDVDADNGLNFTDEELRRVNQVILETALTAESSDGSIDYRTRLAAATYIRDDKKGRKEVVKHIAGNTFNIMSFNEQLAKAREMCGNAKRLVEV